MGGLVGWLRKRGRNFDPTLRPTARLFSFKEEEERIFVPWKSYAFREEETVKQKLQQQQFCKTFQQTYGKQTDRQTDLPKNILLLCCTYVLCTWSGLAGPGSTSNTA